MATKKTADVPAFDVKALSAELGATVKQGVVSASRGKYFIAFGGKKVELPVGQLIPVVDAKKLVGRSIGVVVSKGYVIVITVPGIPGCFWIGCYVGPPEGLRGTISQELRQPLLDAFAKAGVLSDVTVQALKVQTRAQL